MIKRITVTKEMQDKMAEEYNERQDLIDDLVYQYERDCIRSCNEIEEE